MTANELLRECRDRGIELSTEGADGLRWQATAEPPGDLSDLLDDLREHKPEILRELRQRQEHEREAVAADLWQRLGDLHRRAGCPRADGPGGWLTEGVRAAEAQVEAAWLHARAEGTQDAHAAALESLESWWHVAAAFIATAADKGEHDNA